MCYELEGEAKTPTPSTPNRELLRPMRSSVSVREAAFVLQQTEMIVRRRDDLHRVPGHRVRFDAESVRAALGRSTDDLAKLALDAIVAGWFRVPAPSTRWGAPASLSIFSEAIRHA
jgi:hypothetical protein